MFLNPKILILSLLIRLLGKQSGEKEGGEGDAGRVAHPVWECAGTGQADGQRHNATPRCQGFRGVQVSFLNAPLFTSLALTPFLALSTAERARKHTC